jgi:uncharacterized protein (TIRG00374 family)
LALLKVAVSATLLTLVVRRFSIEGLRSELADTRVVALLLPFTLIVAANVAGAVQWYWLMRAAGVDPGFLPALRAYFVGLFFNNFMLGSVGGDVFKIYSVGRPAGEVARVAGATIVDRTIGLSALCTLAVIAVTVELPRERVPMEQMLVVGGFSLAVLGAATCLLHARYGGALARAIGRLPLGPLRDRVRRLLDHLRDYRQRPRVLNGAFVLSLAIQASRVVTHFCVALAMGWSLHASDLLKFFLVIPILGLVISLPISLGGWGVREWAGVAIFAPLGYGGQETVALLALTATLTLVASLAGAVALVVGPGVRSSDGATAA